MRLIEIPDQYVNERRIVRSAGIHTSNKWKKSGTPTNALSVVRSALEKARRRETVSDVFRRRAHTCNPISNLN